MFAITDVAYFRVREDVMKLRSIQMFRHRVFEHIHSFACIGARSVKDAKLLIEYVEAYPFNGKKLTVVSSEDVTKLLLFNVSPLIQKEELFEVFAYISEGLVKVTVLTAAPYKFLSTGTFLIEYRDFGTMSDACALARQRHTELAATLGPEFEVTVAEPFVDYGNEFALCSSAVKVENLPLSCATRHLHRAFNKYGNIVKIRRYAECGVVYFERIEEARKVYSSVGEFVDDEGVGHTVEMAKFLEEGGVDASEKMKAVTVFKLGYEQSLQLAHQLISESPVSERLLIKAGYILAREQEQATSAIGISSICGKRPLEMEAPSPKKTPKIEYTPDESEASDVPGVLTSPIVQRPINENVLQGIISEEQWNRICENYRSSIASVEFTQVSKEVFERMSRREQEEYLRRYSQMTGSKYPRFLI